MPTYEYICNKCGVFEQFHSIKTALTQCPKCNCEVRRLISRNSNIIFKGSGFYVTDHPSGDHAKKEAIDKTDNSSSSNSPTSPSATKTESKAS